jgi:hypothetical protein
LVDQIFLILAIIIPLSIVIFLIIYVFAGFAKYVLVGNSLQIKGIYSKKIPISSINSEGLKIIERKENLYSQLATRINGISLLGYYEGWFKLKNGEKCLLLIKGGSNKLVYIPTTNNYSVILSSETPETLIDSIKQ